MRGRIRSLILVTGMRSPYVVTYLGEFEEDDAAFLKRAGPSIQVQIALDTGKSGEENDGKSTDRAVLSTNV